MRVRVRLDLLTPAERQALYHPWAPGHATITLLVLHLYPTGSALVPAVNPAYPERQLQLPPESFEPIPAPSASSGPPASASSGPPASASSGPPASASSGPPASVPSVPFPAPPRKPWR